jgi:hypothetical protein
MYVCFSIKISFLSKKRCREIKWNLQDKDESLYYCFCFVYQGTPAYSKSCIELRINGSMAQSHDSSCACDRCFDY